MTTFTDRCDEAMARAIADSQNDHGDGTRSDMLFIVNVMHKRYARAARLALLSELDAAGLGVKPLAATDEMITAVRRLDWKSQTDIDWPDGYAAMLAAAPDPFPEDKS